MSLGERQREFSMKLGVFLSWIHRQPGYAISLGEASRSDEQAVINSLGKTGRDQLRRVLSVSGYPSLADAIANNVGSGIAGSLHTLSLAIDLKLFINGIYQTDSAAYLPLGEFWESLGGSWGGRFAIPDGDHFSLAWGGVR